MNTTTSTPTTPARTRVETRPLSAARAFRAELYALTSTRSTWLFMLAIAVGMTPAAAFMSLEQADWSEATAMTDVVLLLIIYANALFMLPPTLPWTYQATPRRALDTLARLGAGLLLSASALALGVGASLVIFMVRGIALDLSAPGSLMEPALRLLIIAPLAAVMAWVFNSAIVGSMVMIADFYLVEILLGSVSNHVVSVFASLLPVINIGVASHQVRGNYQFPEWAAPIILAAWVLGGLVLVAIVARRRPMLR